MGESEMRRSIILRRVSAGALTLEEATRTLGLSYRQMKRIWKRFREEGEKGLSHRNRGRPSNRAFMEQFKEEILRKYRESSMGSGPTRFAGILAEQGILVDHETLRRWLLERGAWKISRSRSAIPPAEPPARGFGEVLTLVSVQGSWLGMSHPPAFLLCLRDESTSRSLCALAREESCEAAMRLLWAWMERHGIPAGIRCQRRFLSEENRHPTLEQQLAGGAAMSALRRSCERLGIESAVLGPSQVRGIFSRLGPLLELVKAELETRAPADVEQAATLLRGPVEEAMNARFAHRQDAGADYHVPILDGSDLRHFLCIDQACRVGGEGVVELGHRRFRLMDGFATRPGRPRIVVVSEWLDGTIHILAGGSEVPFLELVPAAPSRTVRVAI